MNLRQAAQAVLEAAAEPLHYAEIVRRALEAGLWQTEGKTPEATLSAVLGTDIRRRGETSVFQRTGPGMFALRAWGLSEYVLERSQSADALAPQGEEKEQKPEAAPKMTFTAAAEHVLEHYGHGEPMHYRDITDKLMALDLVETQGKTPAATLYAQIHAEIVRATRRGDQARFINHGRGYFGLSRWLGAGLALQINQHNTAIRRQLHTRLAQIAPEAFETLIGELLVALGFEEVQVTEYSGDGGIDVRGVLVVGDVIRTRMAVQVKRWKHNVQKPVIQQVRGSLGAHEQGLIITTSRFTAGARTEAERPDAVPVGLMDGEQLVALLVENDILVRKTPYHLIELTEDA